MREDDLDRYSAHRSMTIVEAMERLDKNAGGVLYVVNEEEQLLGSLSDGDIRRCIIRSGELDATVEDAMRRNVKFLPRNRADEAKHILRQLSIPSIPILDEERHIVDIVFVDKENRILEKEERSLRGVPVIIMAGGKGTRLYPYTRILPKPLIPVEGVPILERIMDRFSEYGVEEFFLTVNYRKEMIKSYFADVEKEYRIHYVEEVKPLGTAGSLCMIDREFSDPIIVTNCDILIQEEYDKIVRRHIESGNQMTVVSSLKTTTIPYGVLHTAENGVITSIDEKPTISNLINTGMYVLDPEILTYIPKDTEFHMTELIEKVMEDGKGVGMYPISENSFLDMGEFEEMQRMEELLKKNV